MNTLKDNWNSPLDCVISLFNTSCNANVTNFKSYLMHALKKVKNFENVLIGEILFPSITILVTKVEQISNTQMRFSFLFDIYNK
jgi:hypothetical protein